VAHLVTSGELAGGQAVALHLARATRAAGHDALFLSPTPGAFAACASVEGFSVELVDVTRTIRVGGAVKLRQLLGRLEVDVLHTHVHLAAGVLGRLAARTAGRVVISHLHIENHFRPQRLARAPLVALDNGTARLCARLVAVSDATRSAFERQGFPRRLLETVHNGVDVAALEAARPPGIRSELGLADDALVLGHVGRLAPVKGQRELLEAVSSLSSRHPGAHVVLIGRDLERDGAYAAELRQLAKALGIDERVHFAGFRSNAAAAIQELDVVVLPSWIEGLPLVVLEAMAHAKPVVATAVGGTPEAVVDGETGLLVPPRDVPALAAALDRILTDASLRDRLGQAGRARASEHFDVEAMTRRVLEIYHDVVSRG
jgi:glycosyltransferase involved in cell wall biosynthesis